MLYHLLVRYISIPDPEDPTHRYLELYEAQVFYYILLFDS